MRILQAKKRDGRCGVNGNSCARCRKCAIAPIEAAVLAGSVAEEEIEVAIAAAEIVEAAGAIEVVEVVHVAAGIDLLRRIPSGPSSMSHNADTYSLFLPLVASLGVTTPSPSRSWRRNSPAVRSDQERLYSCIETWPS